MRSCPPSAFVDRDDELARLTGDLASGQKIFLISPRRYGKSSLVRQAMRQLARQRILTLEVTVSSFSSYVAFLEGFARRLMALETRADRLRKWLQEFLGASRPEVRYELNPSTGKTQVALTFPTVRSARDIARLAEEVFALPQRIAAGAGRAAGDRRSTSSRTWRRSTGAASSRRSARRCSSNATSGTCSPDPSRRSWSG